MYKVEFDNTECREAFCFCHDHTANNRSEPSGWCGHCGCRWYALVTNQEAASELARLTLVYAKQYPNNLEVECLAAIAEEALGNEQEAR